MRGSHIECYGSMDLLLRDERGEPQRIMQADESLYLHPAHAKLPGAAMVVGVDDLPDVVLEVDPHHRRAPRQAGALTSRGDSRKCGVDVPDAPSPSRPRARRPGLTIHLLEDGRYRVAAESRALPGLDRGGDSRGAERGRAVGAHQRGVGAGGRSVGGAGRNRTGRRPADALATASRVRARPSGRTHSGPSGRTPCRRAASPRRNDPPDTGIARYRGLGGVPGRRGVRRCTRRRADFGGARLQGRGGIPHPPLVRGHGRRGLLSLLEQDFDSAHRLGCHSLGRHNPKPDYHVIPTYFWSKVETHVGDRFLARPLGRS